MIRMIRTIICGLTAILVLTSFVDMKDDKTWENADLKGKVKVVKEYAVEKGVKNPIKGNLLKTRVYNANGYKVEEYYNSNGRSEYKYDDKGNLLENCDFDSTGTLTYKETHKFDNKGNIMEDCVYGLKICGDIWDVIYDCFSKTTYKYREDGKLIEELFYHDSRTDSVTLLELYGVVAEPLDYIYHENDKNYQESKEILTGSTIYKYDENGNLIEHSTFDKDSLLRHKDVYKYDWNGNMTEHFRLEDDTLRLVMDAKYDDKNRKIEERDYAHYSLSDGSKLIKVYKFDENGNRIEGSSYHTDGVLHSKIIFKYDKNGKKIEESIYSPENNLVFKEVIKRNKDGKWKKSYTHSVENPVEKYVRKFDKNGNVIKLCRYHDGWLYEKTILKYDEVGNKIIDILLRGGYIVKGSMYEYECY